MPYPEDAKAFTLEKLVWIDEEIWAAEICVHLPELQPQRP